MDGWIKLYRSSLEHWLYTEYRPLTKREAWETILLTVNFEPSKSLIKGQLYDCFPGQSLLSIDNWSKKFVWSIQQVRTFFKMLEADGMIKTEGLQYTTRLTVCNWATYQTDSTNQQHANNKPITDQQQTNNRPTTTIKEKEELKKKKNDKNIILLSKVDESTLDQTEKKYYQIAFSFFELVKSSLMELNIPITEIEKAKYKTWVDPVRLLIENDKRTIGEFREIFHFIQKDEFWKEQIRSTAKLRKKNNDDRTYFEVLLEKSRNGQKRNQQVANSNSGVSDNYKRNISERLYGIRNTEEMQEN